jgi:twitching motility protein PilT
VSLALDAAEAGRLVIGSLSAGTATAAIVRMIEEFPGDRRSQVQLTLADVLRGAVSQVLLRKTGGGRVAAREVLLNTASVARLIAEGKLMQLPAALESGRKHGMVPLNDALVAFVQSGAVDAREAYRKAFDREAFLALLKREGIDTSFVERLA